MNELPDWLPPLVLFTDSGGDWETYEKRLYGWFRKDFIESLPTFPAKRVALKRHPLSKDKEATFWHFISEGETETDRTIDPRRCERIRWPRPLIEAFPNSREESSSIVWWRNQRRNGEWRYVLALTDFSYVVVLADRGDFVLPWTAYCVPQPHRQRKLRKEWEEFWRGQKG